MIIDFHTHLWPGNYITEEMVSYLKSRNIWDESLSALTAEYLLKIMDENRIKLSIVHSVAVGSGMKSKELDVINSYVASQVKKNPDRLMGFFTLNPFEVKHCKRMISKSITELGLTGLKLHPSFQEFYPDDKRIFPIYGAIQERSIPVLFHTGSIGVSEYSDSYSHPSCIDDVACNFPDLKIILGHAGKIWHDETVMLMRKHKNIYAEIGTNIGRNKEFRSLPLAWLLYKIKIWVGSFDRVLFGSDYPIYFQSETKECLTEAAEYLNRENQGFITEEDLEKILFKNAEDLINSIKNSARR